MTSVFQYDRATLNKRKLARNYMNHLNGVIVLKMNKSSVSLFYWESST